MEADRINDVSRLIRRVCLLREQGDLNQAAELERTQLAGELRALRAAEGDTALSAEAVERLYVMERERVAEAAVLVDLILARLSSQPPSAHRPAPTPVVTRRPTSQAPRRQTPAAIPALLDAMLEADRATRPG